MKLRFLAILAAMTLAGAVSCGGNNHAQEEGGKGKGAKEATQAVPVEVSTPVLSAMESTLNLTAAAFSEEQVPVYAEITGIVDGSPVEEGSPVRRGQVLAQLKRQELELALNLAQSKLDKAEADFGRTRELFDGRLVSQDTFDQVSFARDQAKISRDQARVEIQKATITAPIDGVLAERLIRRGDLVKPQQKVFTVVDLRTLKTNLFVPEKNIHEVQTGSIVRVTSGAYPKESFKGRVERVAPVADPNSGTFKVTVALDNPGHLLKPGMFLSASVVLNTRPDALVIPKKSLVYEQENPMVFVVRGDRAHKIAVAPGLTDASSVEIVKGLTRDDRVVTVGQSGLKDGSRVKILTGGGGGSEVALGR